MVLLLFSSSLYVLAQTTFSVSGVVVDSTGAVVRGATVRILAGSGIAAGAGTSGDTDKYD